MLHCHAAVVCAAACVGQLQRNALKTLPLSIGDIVSLEELNVSSNELEVRAVAHHPCMHQGMQA
jgi:hypothetical protein